MPDPIGPARGGASANPEIAGTILAGRYRIIRKLGEGAMGGVYLGEHLKIGRKDAIKVLRGGLAHDAESIARFRRGARNLSRIRHPNVCTLYDYGETEDGSPFLAIEFITGETLQDLIARERRLEPARAFDIARQTAEALRAAHEAGIVHRDLKPSNIMIERDRGGRDIVKVVDFDIAKASAVQVGDELTSVDVVIGTPEYMSPEQLTGEPLDGRSDVYSLGIVLFRMLTGTYPFRGRDAPSIMTERLTARPLTLAEAFPQVSFPPAVQHLLDRALARDRVRRVPGAAELAADLVAIEQNMRAAAQEMTEGATRAWVQPQDPGATRPYLPEPPAESATQPWLQPPPTRPSPTGPMPTAVRPVQRPSRSLVSPLWIGGGIALVAVVIVLFVVLQGGPGPAPILEGNAVVEGGGQGGGDPNGRGAQNDTENGGQANGTDTGIAIDPSKVEDVLLGLLAAMPRDRSASPPEPALLALRDTAQAVYASVSFASEDRALAAFLLANYFWIRDEAQACRDWIDRALSLDPSGRGYREFTDRCRGGKP